MLSLRKDKKNFAANKHEEIRKDFSFSFVCLRVCSRQNFFCVSAFLLCFLLLFAESSAAQTQKPKPTTPAKKVQTVSKKSVSSLPKVTQIDADGLKKLLVPNGKPLLVNFWATWCDPCREEYPDLVKINSEYKDKINFITVSLDDLAEINRAVPKFLAEMKANMPSYLLKTADEETAITMVSKDYQGGLPFTILYNERGETVYTKQGKIQVDLLRREIEKLAAAQTQLPK